MTATQEQSESKELPRIGPEHVELASRGFRDECECLLCNDGSKAAEIQSVLRSLSEGKAVLVRTEELQELYDMIHGQRLGGGRVHFPSVHQIYGHTQTLVRRWLSSVPTAEPRR